MNRRIRNRTSGGVGGRGREAPPYPIAQMGVSNPSGSTGPRADKRELGWGGGATIACPGGRGSSGGPRVVSYLNIDLMAPHEDVSTGVDPQPTPQAPIKPHSGLFSSAHGELLWSM